MLAFMRLRAIQGVEQFDDDGLKRNIRLGERAGGIAIYQSSATNQLELHIEGFESSADIAEVERRVRRMLDLDADMAAIHAHLGCDPQLAPLLAARPGLRLPSAWDPFEYFIRAVLGQQISVKAATTLAGRIAAHGPASDVWPALPHQFPSAEEFLKIDLTQIGLTKTRQQTLTTVATAVVAGNVVLEETVDLEAFVQQAVALKGIGPWTAHYVAMRGLKQADAFPVGDLGLIKALAADQKKMRDRDMLARAEGWRPYRAYATLHLWQSLSE